MNVNTKRSRASGESQTGADGVDAKARFSPFRIFRRGSFGWQIFLSFVIGFFLLISGFAIYMSQAEPEMSWRNAVFILLASALSLLAAWYMANRLSSRIGSLVSVAERVQTGNLDMRFKVSGNVDEIDILGQSLNQMLDALTKAEQKLLASSRYARSLLETSLDPLVTISTEGKITDVNKATEQATGVDREDLIGSDFSNYFTESKKAQEGYQQVFSEGSVTNYPLAIRHATGEVTHVLYNASVFRDREGAVVGVFAAARDVTERQRAEKELRRYKDHLEEEVHMRLAELKESNEQLTYTQLAMDRAGIGIEWVDADTGRFLYVSDRAANMLGYSQQEMLALSVPDIDPNLSHGNFKDQTLPLREMGYSTLETLRRHKDGRIIPTEVTFYCQTFDDNRGNRGNRFISFTSEISARKQAQAELIQTKEAAEAANKAKSVFLANMSHELRTPLTAILGFSNILRRDAQLPDTQRESLNIIIRSGEHLLSLINDVLEMAKFEAGRIQLHETSFDLGLLVRDATDMISARALGKGLPLAINQSPDIPQYIFGDEARLRQILINLLGNAVKFTSEGGINLRLRIKQGLLPRLQIEVEDSGIGIAAQDQERIFEPFVQLGEHGINLGTGLGLTITRQLVQLMGGSLSLESTPGQGSLFRVELPLNQAAEADMARPLTADHGEVVGLEPGQPDYRILIVEDQLENRTLLSRLMMDLGLQVKLAQEGRQGVELFQSWQPHLIWMDHLMPVMNGIEATRAIRQLPGGKDVRIIAVTASAFIEQRDEMLAAGMNAFVRKPYHLSEIYQCLSEQLGVQYVFGEAGATVERSVALTPEMLCKLSLELRCELKSALESLEDRRIQKVLQQIAAFDPKLHALLAQLVQRFDYPSILNSLNDPKCSLDTSTTL